MASLARGEDFTDDLPVGVCFLAPMDPKRDKDVVVVVVVADWWTGANAEAEPTRRRTMEAVVADFMVVVLVLLNKSVWMEGKIVRTIRTISRSLTHHSNLQFGGKESAIEIDSSIRREEIGNRNRPKSTRQFGGKGNFD